MARSMKSTAAHQEGSTEENPTSKASSQEYSHESESVRQRIPEPKCDESSERKAEITEMHTGIKVARAVLSVLIFACMCAIMHFGNEYKKRKQEVEFSGVCGSELAKIMLFVGISSLLLVLRSYLVQKYRN